MLDIKNEAPAREFNHLIKLLDDEDEGIYTNIRERFISLGQASSDFLQGYTEDDNFLIRNRANEIISTINIEKLEKRFSRLSSEKNILEDAVFTIAEFGYPGYDRKKYEKKLDIMAQSIKKNLDQVNPDKGKLTAISKLNAVNTYLFDEMGFSGNRDDYYDPDNSFMNRVLDTKLGNPISLSVVYLLLSKRLGLPVFGVNLPGHFIVKYIDKDDEYFVDPFNQGVIVSRPEAAEFIKNLGMSDEEFENLPYLNIADEKDIVIRMLRNLSETYKEKNDEVRAQQIERLMLSLV